MSNVLSSQLPPIESYGEWWAAWALVGRFINAFASLESGLGYGLAEYLCLDEALSKILLADLNLRTVENLFKKSAAARNAPEAGIKHLAHVFSETGRLKLVRDTVAHRRMSLRGDPPQALTFWLLHTKHSLHIELTPDEIALCTNYANSLEDNFHSYTMSVLTGQQPVLGPKQIAALFDKPTLPEPR
jgi:hypothetical protein